MPDPKLFEFDPNFLKDCEKIEKRPIDGGEIEGQIVNNEFNGKGRIHFDNGDIYEGEIKNGTAYGKGIFIYPDGCYNGQWIQDKREGYGVQKSNESYYEGEWKNDKIEGKGKMIFTEKCEVYEGDLKMIKDMESEYINIKIGTYTMANGSMAKEKEKGK